MGRSNAAGDAVVYLRVLADNLVQSKDASDSKRFNNSHLSVQKNLYCTYRSDGLINLLIVLRGLLMLLDAYFATIRNDT